MDTERLRYLLDQRAELGEKLLRFGPSMDDRDQLVGVTRTIGDYLLATEELVGALTDALAAERSAHQSRQFGPKTANHPSIGEPCPGCRRPFAVGDYTTLVTVGPGDDTEGQERMRAGRPYNAVSVEAHWTCVTGETVDPD